MNRVLKIVIVMTFFLSNFGPAIDRISPEFNGRDEIYETTLSEDVNDLSIIEAKKNESMAIKIDQFNYVTPEMFGAKADGITDDTIAIQSALDSRADYIYFPGDIYLHSTIVISGKNKTIDGRNSLHIMSVDGYMFSFDGYCENIVFKNVKGVGRPEISNTTFIGNHSKNSNSFNGIVIENCTVTNMVVGISINTDLAGKAHGIIIRDNTITNCYGTESGHGYGIHIANGNDNDVNGIITRNNVRGCQRHAIYVARGRNYKITDNFISDHRSSVFTGSLSAAVNCVRSQNVEINGNILADCYDGYLYLESDTIPAASMALDVYPCKNIDIHNNVFMGHTNINYLYIGKSGTARGYPPTNIYIHDNKFDINKSISIQYGINVRIERNLFSGAAGDYAINMCALQESDAYYIIDNVYQKDLGYLVRIDPSAISKHVHMVFCGNKSTSANKIMYCPETIETGQYITIIDQDYTDDLIVDDSLWSILTEIGNKKLE